MIPDLVLYHSNCPDGFGAAWAVWKQFPTAVFMPAEHGQPPPVDCTGRNVLIADFSYPRPVLEQMKKAATDLLVLDHHITAKAALEGLPYAHFNLQKSGAVLAWEWAHGTPAPWLLQYIQDKDLFTWKLPASREIVAAISSYPYDFKVWDSLKQDSLEREGQAILRYEQKLITQLVEEMIRVRFEGQTVPCVHSAVLTSQIGERLSANWPFCIIWHDRNGRRYFSMRSREGGMDVAAIAVKYSGGGHTHAAGFSVSLTEAGSPPADGSTPGIPIEAIEHNSGSPS